MANGWTDDRRSPWEDDRNRDRQRYGADEGYGGEDYERDFADYGPFRGNYPRNYGRYEPNLPYGSERLGSSRGLGYSGAYRRRGPGGYGTVAQVGTYGGGYGGGYGRQSRGHERYGDFRRGSWNEWGEPSWGRPDYYEGEGESWGWGQGRPLWDRTRDEVRSWMGDQEAARRRETDVQRGGHYGRGPRGYSRSDERIREDLNDRPTDDWSVDATDIEVKVSNCEVTLNGAVDSRQAKRRAEGRWLPREAGHPSAPHLSLRHRVRLREHPHPRAEHDL